MKEKLTIENFMGFVEEIAGVKARCAGEEALLEDLDFLVTKLKKKENTVYSRQIKMSVDLVSSWIAAGNSCLYADAEKYVVLDRDSKPELTTYSFIRDNIDCIHLVLP